MAVLSQRSRRLKPHSPERLAVGITLSPVPIIAVVLMLTSRKARVQRPGVHPGLAAGPGHRRRHRPGPGWNQAGPANPGRRPPGSAGSGSRSVSCCCWSLPASSGAGRTAASNRRRPSGWPRSTRPPARGTGTGRCLVRRQPQEPAAGRGRASRDRSDRPTPRRPPHFQHHSGSLTDQVIATTP